MLHKTSLGVAWILFFFLTLELPAETLIKADGSVSRYDLAPYLFFLEDKTLSLSFEEVLDKDDDFIQNVKNSPNFGLSRSAIWGKIAVQGSINNHNTWALLLDYPLIEFIEFYLPDGTGKYFKVETGLKSPNKKETVYMPKVSIPVHLNPVKPEIIYFRIISKNDPIEIPLLLVTKQELEKISNSDSLFHGFYYGLLFIMFLYNLFIFFMVRDKSYLYYTLYVLFLLMIMSGVHGRLEFFFGNDYTLYRQVAQIFISLGPIFANLFVKQFLHTKRNTPRLNIVLNVYIGLYGFYLLFSMFTDFYPALYYFTVLSTGSIFALAAGFFLYTKYQYARYYTHAWLIYLTALIMYSSRSMNINIPLSNYMLEIGGMIEVSLLSFALASRIRLLQDQTERDDLTGVYNRNAMQKYLNKMILEKKERQLQNNLSMIVIDIDDFKLINDTFGHLTGDRILKEVVKTIAGSIRSDDLLARWGGEEFVAVLPDADIVNTARISESIRKKVSETRFILEHQVTISIGIASLQPGETTRDLFHRADLALYQAKKTGKNKVAAA